MEKNFVTKIAVYEPAIKVIPVVIGKIIPLVKLLRLRIGIRSGFNWIRIRNPDLIPDPISKRNIAQKKRKSHKQDWNLFFGSPPWRIAIFFIEKFDCLFNRFFILR